MLFRRLFLCALFVGLCAGLATSLVQRWQVLPLILAAEVFESAGEAAPAAAHDHAADHAAGHDHAGHAHDAAAWQPQDGAERTFWTVVANVAGATGFALLLLPLLALWDHRRGGRGAGWRSGLLWGGAGWLALFVWPALGLHPELPGEAAAALDGRQAWWLLAVACAAGGLALAAFGRGGLRWLGLPLLALPFLIGAPQAAGPAFASFSADAAARLQALKSQFLVATALATAVQWAVLGMVGGLLVPRWLRPALQAAGGAPAVQAAPRGAA